MTPTRSADVIRALRARSDEVDSWLRALLRDPGKGVALVAVGSLGRREPSPHSDFDLVIVHDKRRKDVRAIAEAVWYPIWDAGQRLDHSVRTLDEALAVASADLKVGLGLLEGRYIAGDEALATQLLERWSERWRRGARRWLPQLAAAVRERHAGAGDVAFDLHPDLKDGRGGLRDIEAMRAAAKGWDGVASIADEPSIVAAHRRLLAVRVALHEVAGRTDRLALQEQDGVARALGVVSADALLADVATAARRVAWLSDDVWRRVQDWKRGPTSRRSTSDRAVGPGLVVRDEEVHLDPAADPATDPTLALRAAAAAASSEVPLSRSALDRLAESAPPLPSPWPAAARSALVGILGSGHAVTMLEALDQVGVLARMLPEWATVRSRPQRNAYHRWTVDRHLCEAANGAAALTRRVDRPDLLLVGTWLHDLGKGVGGRDHTEAGCHLMRSIAARMGFPPEDVHVLVEMVRLHLLLPDVATRRDVTDPTTVERVAAEVGDERTLRLLWALTEADSRATGPAAWSQWKASLVAELVERVSAVLAERPAPPSTRAVLPALLPKPARPGGLALAPPAGDDGRLVVAGPDRPGFLATVAGVLAVAGLDVLSADVGREEGVAFQVWTVEPAAGRWPDWQRLQDDLEAAVEGRFPLAERLGQRLRAYEPVRRRRQAAPAAPHVSVDSDEATAATVVEVRAGDAVGLLHRVAAALTSCGLDIRSARVQTLGHEVVDTFYVVTTEGQKLDRETAPRVVQAVFAAV